MFFGESPMNEQDYMKTEMQAPIRQQRHYGHSAWVKEGKNLSRKAFPLSIKRTTELDKRKLEIF